MSELRHEHLVVGFVDAHGSTEAGSSMPTETRTTVDA